jgi:general secretion pathway protein D
VNVLSSPQITVIDNQQARLQVGSLVPYLTASSQSTVTSGAPIVNSVAYQPTGVILSVTPRVNASGLVTLDVSQEVSDVNSATTTSGISSPTFDERAVSTRVVLQDGQTVGLAGLIQDSISRGNQGIPWLKDIPILGVLAGTQTNTRTRTELLVLITPHVIRSANDMRKLTDDIRDGLAAASAVPLLSAREPVSGSDDPNRRVRQGVRRALSRDVEP